jgi:hypothetical protein
MRRGDVILSEIGCSRPPFVRGSRPVCELTAERDVLVTRVVIAIVFVAAKAGTKANRICMAPDLSQEEVGH